MEVVEKIKYTMKKNLFKLVISQVIIGILSLYMLSFALMPILNSLTTGNISIPYMAIFFIFLFILSSIQFVLQYGFFVLVFLFYNNEYAVLVHLFTGFRDFKRAFIVGLFYTGVFYTGVFMGIFMIFGVVFSLLLSYNIVSADFFSIDILYLIVTIIAMITLVFLYCKFGCTWFFLYENSLLTVKEALKKSIEVTQENFKNFLALCVKTAGVYILLFIVFSVVQNVLIYGPMNLYSEEVNKIVIAILNVLSTVFLYLSILRLCFSLVAMYKIYTESPRFVNEIDTRLNQLQLLAQVEDNENQ